MRFYRITPEGRAAVARACEPLRSRYLADLLDMCGAGIWERELRQFMPPASLQASIGRLLEMGLIQCEEPPQRLAA